MCHEPLGRRGHQQQVMRFGLVYLVTVLEIGILRLQALEEVFVGIGLLAESLKSVVELMR